MTVTKSFSIYPLFYQYFVSSTFLFFPNYFIDPFRDSSLFYYKKIFPSFLLSFLQKNGTLGSCE